MSEKRDGLANEQKVAEVTKPERNIPRRAAAIDSKWKTKQMV